MCDEVYENTHIERVNDTIKNQYLNRMSIGTEQELKRKVDRVIDTYNTKRPHQSLAGLSPCDYEFYLETTPLEKRINMEIYTSNKTDKHDPRQLSLVFN